MNTEVITEKLKFEEKTENSGTEAVFIDRTCCMAIVTKGNIADKLKAEFEPTKEEIAKTTRALSYEDGQRVKLSGELLKVLLKAIEKGDEVVIEVKNDYPARFTIGDTKVIIAPRVEN